MRLNGLLVGIAFVIGPPLHRKMRAVLFALVEISTKVSGIFNQLCAYVLLYVKAPTLRQYEYLFQKK